MKRCPQCGRNYNDDSLSFCLDDGSELLFGPATDEPATAILSESRQVGIATGFRDGETTRPKIDSTGAEAEPQENLGDLSERQTLSAHRAAKPLIALGIAIILLLGGFFGYRYFSSAGSKQIDSIAVMPFVNESGNPDVEYLSDGMTETLINSLTQLPNLNVKPRSSAFRYKGRETDAKTIGTELNVGVILNGRLVQRGEDITLFLSLVDTGTENQIWGKQYSRKLANLVTLQNEIVRDVSESLKSKLSGADVQKLAKNYTQNAEAYQLYLKGRFHHNKRTLKDSEKAIEYFQQAIAIDPNYALAYAGLADAYHPNLVFRMSRLERMPKAREAAIKALSLDNDLAEAHTALGVILWGFDYDFAGSEREYRRAIELNPNYAEAHYRYAQLLRVLGRWDEALAKHDLSLKLEPLSLVYNHAYAEYLIDSRRYDEAIGHLKKILELDENFLLTHLNLADAYGLKGNYSASVEERARIREINGDNKSAALVRESFAKSGWEGYLRHVTGEGVLATTTFYSQAALHVLLGEKDKAFAALDKSYENREFQITRLKTNPRFDPLHDDPRIGIPE